MMFGTVLCVLCGFEAGMVFAIRASWAIETVLLSINGSVCHQPAYRAGNHRPVQFFGIMSSILLSSALLWVPDLELPYKRDLKGPSPQYYEIYKHREVIGISIAFMAVDLLGGVFSDLSLAFKPNIRKKPICQFVTIIGLFYTYSTYTAYWSPILHIW